METTPFRHEVRADDTVFVETAARLHFGVLDLRGSLGRWFGGIGAAAPAPTLLLSARHADRLEVHGDDAERAGEFAVKMLAHYDIDGGARICLHRVVPRHAGLGSGTQLGLAVARALAELYGLPSDPAVLSRAIGRAERSAIGTWTFAGGGLVVEGGRLRDGRGPSRVAPLLARLAFPPSWHCVVAVPTSTVGLSGSAEDVALSQLQPPPEHEVERVAHLVLLALLPALADGDLDAFGSALTSIQTMNGRWFAPVQGGVFASGPSRDLVQRMAAWGAVGVGQSSWGPAVYGIVDGKEAAERLAERVRGALEGDGVVYHGPFQTTGARVWREPAAARGSRPEPGGVL